LGLRTLDEAIGRTDRLRPRALPHPHWKAATLDLAPLLARAERPGAAPRFIAARPRADAGLDEALLPKVLAGIERGRPVTLDQPIGNVNRSVGAWLAGALAHQAPDLRLPEGAVTVRFCGSAGQSFGAFLTAGLAFELRGDANDYVAKGLSGGRIVVRPPDGTRFAPEENVIVGNTVLYGATGGELFINGLAGERFAVRNSG
ncbi:MAG: glutamate synthase subunit alpha, partial [Caldilineaceae bacterium]|nr:glutamate synthase subunit alpha [Caldilineaceae bacterium]